MMIMVITMIRMIRMMITIVMIVTDEPVISTYLPLTDGEHGLAGKC